MELLLFGALLSFAAVCRIAIQVFVWVLTFTLVAMLVLAYLVVLLVKGGIYLYRSHHART